MQTATSRKNTSKNARIVVFNIPDTMTAISAAAFILIAAYVFLSRTPANAFQGRTVQGKVIRVVDGDSLYISGHTPQIRLWGVDAPERRQAGFHAATKELKYLAYGVQLRCAVIDIDRYGRTVGRCFLPDGRDLSKAMIESGTAREYTHFTKGYYSGHKD